MTFLTQLSVVNDMLALLSESPLNSLEEDHDLVPACLAALRNASFREQSKSWWFNQELVTLSPDAGTGNIMLPIDTIKVDPVNGSLNFVARGRRLYKPYAPANEDRLVFTQDVQVELVRMLDFEDLPLTAQLFISASAKLQFQTNYDGDAPAISMLQQEYKDAYITLNAEHIRNRDVNLIRRPTTANLLNNIGIRPNPGGLPIY